MLARFWRLCAPPPGTAVFGEAQARSAFAFRATVICVAMALDAMLLFGLRGAPHVRPDVLTGFAVTNLSILALDLGLSIAWLRRPGPRYRLALLVAALLELVSVMVWIQVTGTVSSYFISGAVALLMIYRAGFDYWTGLCAFVAAVSLHVGAFALDELGVLRPAALFDGELGAVYAVPGYRAAALASILGTYLFAFVAGGYFEIALSTRDRALHAARRDLARLAVGQEAGRLAGASLAGYRMGGRLGRGGMGEVYRAHRVADGREVAIKVLHSHLAELPELVRRFSREAELVSRLPRAFVPELLEFGHTSDGEPFLVMELLEGADLSTHLAQRGVLSPAESSDLAASLAAALDAAHALGVIHRDLKPQNVFVTVPWQVKLLDFGISRLLEGTAATGLTGTNGLLGSPGYLAPELVEGRPVGPCTDVFAAGAILYRALTGHDAFPSRSPSAAIYEALHLHPPPPSSLRELPLGIDAVLAVALAKQPGQRYQQAGELARDLALAVAGRLPEAVLARAASLQRAPEARTMSMHAGGVPRDPAS